MSPAEAKEIIHSGVHDRILIDTALSCAEDALDYRIGLKPIENEEEDGTMDGKTIIRKFLSCGNCNKSLYLGENFCPNCGMRVL